MSAGWVLLSFTVRGGTRSSPEAAFLQLSGQVDLDEVFPLSIVGRDAVLPQGGVAGVHNKSMSSLDCHPAHTLLEHSIALIYNSRINSTHFREALARVLHSAPHLAGRARLGEDGVTIEVDLSLTGSGVPVIYAQAASVRPSQLRRHSKWLSREHGHQQRPNPLAPRLAVAGVITGLVPLLALQLTTLAGGSAVGLTFSHHLFDWEAAALFLKALADATAALSRGQQLPPPSVYYAPELLEARAQGAPESFVPQSFQPLGSTWHQLKLLARVALTAYRRDYEEVHVVAPKSLSPGLKDKCLATAIAGVSEFDCILALVWQQLVRSDTLDSRPTALRQSVSLRGDRLDPPLPPGYLSNAYLPRVTPKRLAKDVAEAPLGELASLAFSTREAVTSRVACDELQSLRELREEGELEICIPALAPAKLWRRWDPKNLVLVQDLRGQYFEADFGFGPPLWVHHHAMTIFGQLPAGGPTSVTITSSPPREGGLELRLVLRTSDGQARRFLQGWETAVQGLLEAAR